MSVLLHLLRHLQCHYSRDFLIFENKGIFDRSSPKKTYTNLRLKEYSLLKTDSDNSHCSVSLKATRKERLKHDKVIYYILAESKLYKHRRCLKL